MSVVSSSTSAERRPRLRTKDCGTLACAEGSVRHRHAKAARRVRTTAGAFASSAGCVCRFRLRVFAIEARRERSLLFTESLVAPPIYHHHRRRRGPPGGRRPPSPHQAHLHARPGLGAERPWRRPAASSCCPWRTRRHARSCLLRATLTGCLLALTLCARCFFLTELRRSTDVVLRERV